jgi:hypothetical protein
VTQRYREEDNIRTDIGFEGEEWRHMAQIDGLVVSSSEHSNEPLHSTIHK